MNHGRTKSIRETETMPVLANPDFTKPFVLQCNAIYQIGSDGKEQPIAYMSIQRNFSVTEVECLAAVLAVRKFIAYIESIDFKIVADHATLKWLMSQKDLSGQLNR